MTNTTTVKTGRKQTGLSLPGLEGITIIYVPLRFNVWQGGELDLNGKVVRERTSVTIGHISQSTFDKYSLGELSTQQLKTVIQAAYFNETGIWKGLETCEEFLKFRGALCQGYTLLSQKQFIVASAIFLDRAVGRTLSENTIDFSALTEKSKLFLHGHRFFCSYRKKIGELCVAKAGSIRKFHELVPKTILPMKVAGRDWRIENVNYQQEELKENICKEYAEENNILQMLERDKSIAKMEFFESACIEAMENFPYNYGQVLGFLALGKFSELLTAVKGERE